MMEKEVYILGIDQGGTKTAAAVMRGDGYIVGSAVAKGAYFPSEGMERALEPVQEAVEKAVEKASINREDITLTVAGISGLAGRRYACEGGCTGKDSAGGDDCLQ